MALFLRQLHEGVGQVVRWVLAVFFLLWYANATDVGASRTSVVLIMLGLSQTLS